MQPALTIYVNRRRFDEAHGVNPELGTADVAALVGIPGQNAVVEREVAPGEFQEIARGERIVIENGMSFLVTREFVTGGRG